MARILVIDDEDSMLEILQEMLEDAGYEVVCASDGEEGVRLYHEAPTDLIVTDIVMPKKDGVAVVWELRADYPEAKILAMTGYDPVALPITEQLGVVATFKKPFKMQEFLKAVRDILEERG
jgi:DNA-binding NtrC family response regulator